MHKHNLIDFRTEGGARGREEVGEENIRVCAACKLTCVHECVCVSLVPHFMLNDPRQSLECFPYPPLACSNTTKFPLSSKVKKVNTKEKRDTRPIDARCCRYSQIIAGRVLRARMMPSALCARNTRDRNSTI